MTTQPFVDGREGTENPGDRVAIDEAMRALGFFRDGRGASYTNPKLRLRATDARGPNFIMRPEGSAFPIDVNLTRLAAKEEAGEPSLFESGALS